MAQIDLSLEINIVRHKGFSVHLRTGNPSVETLGGREQQFSFQDERIFKSIYGPFLRFSKSQLNKKLRWSVSALPWLDLSFQRTLSLSLL